MMDEETRRIYEDSGVKPFAPLPEPGSVEAPKEAAAVTPPKDTAPKARARTSTTTTRTTSLEKRLTDMYVQVGAAICIKDPTCGQAVIQAAPETAAALEGLAKENKAVRKALEKMLQGGAWGGVFMAHFPIVITVLAHHGVLPPNTASVLNIEPKAKPTLRTVPSTEDGSSVGDGRES